MAAFRAGDARAWEALVTRYQRLIYSVPMRFGLREDEADDVFQQACLRLYERLDTLREPEHVAAWLVSTSRRLSLDAIGRRRHEVADDAGLTEHPDSGSPIDEHLADLEQQQRVRTAVERLNERCRALIYHLFYDPTAPSYQQIAATLGLETGSVGPTRARCFARLRTLLEP